MRPAFYPEASFFGHAGGQLASRTQFLFDWIDKNGPAPKIEPRQVSQIRTTQIRTIDTIRDRV
jgi:hypothetical protein